MEKEDMEALEMLIKKRNGRESVEELLTEAIIGEREAYKRLLEGWGKNRINT